MLFRSGEESAGNIVKKRKTGEDEPTVPGLYDPDHPFNKPLPDSPKSDNIPIPEDDGVGKALDNLGVPTNMDIDPEQSLERSAGNQRSASGGNPQSKETPVSPFPTLPYGLQETHTTIIPYTFWLSAIKLDYTAADVKLRMNTPALPHSTTALGGQLTTPKSIQSYKAQNTDDPSTNSLTFPATFATTNQCAWSSYWAKLYQQYTVIGCEWKIILRNAREAQNAASNSTNRDALLAWEYDSSSAADSGNLIPDGAALKHVQQWKGINWKTIPSGYGNPQDIVLQGTYKPGSIPRMVKNDGDVKTWNPTGGGNSTSWTAPALKDDLHLMFFHHPLAQSGTQTVHVNMEIQLKYIVQFKDLIDGARYPAGQTDVSQTVPSGVRIYT